jgi:hypothetical protein
VASKFGFLPLGGTSVGASCYLYALESTRLLIDCGVQPGMLGADSLPKLELLRDHRPDALVITHAHSDHIGALAVVKLLFPDLPVYMTQATARITLPMLLDAARVAQRNGSPMFNEADGVKALQQVTTFAPDSPFEIGEVTLTPRVSGHIVGAVGLMLEATLSGGLTWLAVVALINMAVSLYYYLIPVAEMYLKPATGSLTLPNRAGYISALSLSLLGTLALGIAPAPTLSLTHFLSRLLGG